MSESGSGRINPAGANGSVPGESPVPRRRPRQFPPKPPGAMSPERTLLSCGLIFALLLLCLAFWGSVYWYLNPEFHASHAPPRRQWSPPPLELPK